MSNKELKILRSLYNGCVEALYDFEETPKHTVLLIKNDHDQYRKNLRKYQKQWLKNHFASKNLNAKQQRWLLDLATNNRVYQQSWKHCYFTEYRKRKEEA